MVRNRLSLLDKIIANERVDTRENNRTFKIGDEEDRKRVIDASIVNHRNEMRQKMKEVRWNNSK